MYAVSPGREPPAQADRISVAQPRAAAERASLARERERMCMRGAYNRPPRERKVKGPLLPSPFPVTFLHAGTHLLPIPPRAGGQSSADHHSAAHAAATGSAAALPAAPALSVAAAAPAAAASARGTRRALGGELVGDGGRDRGKIE